MPTVPITIDSNAAWLLKNFHDMPARVQKAAQANLARELIILQGEVRSKTGIKWQRGARGLSGRLTSWAAAKPNIGLDGAIGFRKTSGFPYELSQEFGAKAQPGKAMAVPLTPEAKKAGSPRNMRCVLFIPKGTHVLAESVGHVLVNHYVLIKSLKPRLKFGHTVQSPAAIERISNALLEAMKA